LNDERGSYRVPEERMVAYTLRTSQALTHREGKVVMPLLTDELGMRARRTPVPTEARRIVVLGDSVAFGFGLDEGGTLAEQLESVLNALQPVRPVACFTVAVPSWNATDAFRFLLDHLDHYRPDIVLWLPVSNDLEDAYGVDENGQRRFAPDVFSPHPRLHLRPDWPFLALRAKAVAPERRLALGPEILVSGLAPLSRARFVRAVAECERARARLARTGARLFVAAHEQSDYQRELRATWLRAGLDLDELALFEALEKDDTLLIDPHPSARTVGVMARWLAGELVAEGLVDAGGGGLAVPEESYATRRAQLPTRQEALAWSAARTARANEELEPRIDPETMQGLLQVYGGLNLDGTLEPHFAAALPAGRTLVVELEPLAEAPEPFEVEVLLGNTRLGVVSLGVSGPVRAEFPLAGEPGVVDVHLVASDSLLREARGKRWLAAARFVALEVLP
jgi:hypothetical protein